MIALNAYCCIFQAAWVLEAACVFQWNIKAAALPLLFVYTKVPCRVLQGLFLSMQEFIAKHFKHLLHRLALVMRSVPAQRLPSHPYSCTRNIHRESHALRLQIHNRSAWIRYPSPIVKTDR